MSLYYNELIDFITRECGLDRHEKVIYSNVYVTFEDYLAVVSEQDTIKSLLALLKRLPSKKAVHHFLRETIAIIIQEILHGHDEYRKLYGKRLKVLY